jgi:small subunit ribosomal protein S16
MPTKIRLARHGRKGYAYYHIVVADSRAPRDGKFIERIGSYNPNTNPATIDLDFDKALDWVLKGAQPTDTTKSILSKEGVMYMKHLLGGVKKGAFTVEDANKKFEAWKAEKAKQIRSLVEKMSSDEKAAYAARLDREKKINEERIAAIAAANAPVVEEVEEVAAEEEVVSESAPEEATEATTEDKTEE